MIVEDDKFIKDVAELLSCEKEKEERKLLGTFFQPFTDEWSEKDTIAIQALIDDFIKNKYEKKGGWKMIERYIIEVSKGDHYKVYLRWKFWKFYNYTFNKNKAKEFKNKKVFENFKKNMSLPPGYTAKKITFVMH